MQLKLPLKTTIVFLLIAYGLGISFTLSYDIVHAENMYDVLSHQVERQ